MTLTHCKRLQFDGGPKKGQFGKHDKKREHTHRQSDDH